MAGRSRWDEVSELLAEAGRIAPAERDAYLRNRTADESVRSEILSLLAVEMPSGDLLEGAAFDCYQPGVGAQEHSATEPRLAIGEVVASRFHIESFLGRGGMGEVYKAEDRELGERVALKLLHPELASQAGFLDRFRREIRLARRISHPNVARVFDLVQEPAHQLGALHFYVLELLNGETLAQRIKRDGAMDLSEALEIAKQMAGGLAAVHAAGVLHRDFKPANVMLTDGRAVVTDFGLAAPIVRESGRAAMPTTSLLLGTPGYMPPEQWAGKPASTAGDIYSLGIVLYEMLTAQHPSVDVGIQLPEPWRSVIARCLELEPRARWRTVAEIGEALTPRLWSRRLTIFSLTGAAAMSLFAYGSRQYLRLPAQIGRVKRLLLGDIRNMTGNSRFDGASELLYGQLRQSPQIQMVTLEQQREVLERMKKDLNQPLDAITARELAWRIGSPAVVHATLAPIGTGYSLGLSLEVLRGRPDAVEVVAEKSFRASGPEDLAGQFRVAAAWLRTTVGENAHDVSESDFPPQEVTTVNWVALSRYSKARQLRRAREFDLAEQNLKEALEADPSFVGASRELADLWIQNHRYEEGIRQWQSTMSLLAKSTLNIRERYDAEAIYYGDVFEFDRALNTTRAWTIRYPEDAPAFFHHGSYLAMADRWDEATAAMEKSWSLDPGSYTARWLAVLGWFRNDTRQTDQALENLMAKDKSQYLRTLGQTQFLRNEVEASENSFRQLSKLPGAVQFDLGHAYLTCLYAETGRWEQALTLSRQHILGLRRYSNQQTLARRLLQQAYLLQRAGDRKLASVAVEEATKLEAGPRHLIRLATILRMVGNESNLAELSVKAKAWPEVRIYQLARGWVDMELESLRVGMVDAGRVDRLLSTVPASLLPRALTLANASRDPLTTIKIWYMADHHWPGLSR